VSRLHWFESGRLVPSPEATQARLNSILDNLAEGVLVADLQGHVIFANPAARAMLGVSREESREELPDP
jgi:PAS domain S-box-containing protein